MKGEKKRVLIAINKLTVGGAEMVVVNHANALHDRDHTVWLGLLFRTDKKEHLYDQVRLPDDRIVHFDYSGVFDFLAIVRIYKFLKTQKIAVLMTHLFEASYAFRIAAFFARTKLVVTFEHSTDFSKHFWQRMAEKILSRTSKLVAVSQATADQTAAQLGITPSTFAVFPHMLSDKQTALSADEARTALGVNPGDTVIISIGRFVADKAQERIIAIADFLNKQKITDIAIVIIGYGPRKDELQSLIKAQNLEQMIKLFESDRPAREYLAAADMFILTSQREGLPVALLEAMHAGLPPLVPALGGMASIVRDGENGLIIDPRDSEASAASVKSLASDPRLRAALSKAARHRVNEVTSTTEDLERLIGC